MRQAHPKGQLKYDDRWEAAILVIGILVTLTALLWSSSLAIALNVTDAGHRRRTVHGGHRHPAPGC